MHVTRGGCSSPCEVFGIIATAWKRVLWRRAAVEQRWKLDPAIRRACSVQVTESAMASKKFGQHCRAAALQVVSGTVPTNLWLSEHGWHVIRSCPCGAVDTVEHRLTGCSHFGSEGIPRMTVAERRSLPCLLH